MEKEPEKIECCNLTDHIRLPIIHTRHTYITETRDRNKYRKIADYINKSGSIQYRELNRVLIWLNSVITMITK